MSLTADQFAKSVITAGLSSAEEIKSLWNSLPAGSRPKDGETFAKLLIEREKLTQFQASELLSGGATPLTLGDYVLLAKIGEGGMGQVLKAQHRHMDRLAAIKLLPPALTQDPEAVKRFQREVKAAAKLSHPNIVQTYDAGVQRGVWYLVMEFVEGRDLAAVVAQSGPLPVQHAVDAILQAAKGLAFAHESGVVHRDIKPANLLLDQKGTVKILDMGLARIDDKVAAQDGLTQSGQVMGTVDYMAPEQAFDTRHADARADIYSLGCTLYRLLTGKNMYDGETMVQKLMGHQNKPIPSLAAQRPNVQPALVALFEKMVAKKPEDRFQTMAEVEAALAALLAGSAAGASAPKPTGDSKLTTFLQGLTGQGQQPQSAPASVAILTGLVVGDNPATGTAPTVSLVNPLHSTDPVSQRSIQLVKELSSPPAPPSLPAPAKSPPRHYNNLFLVLGGLGGVLLLFLGVWVIVRDKDGKEVGRIKVPDGGTAKIENPSQTPLAPPRGEGAGVRGPAPPPAKAPFDSAQAKAHQEAWAAHLGVKVVEPNSISMQLALIPPGEFRMGSSDEDVALALKIAEETKLDANNVKRIQEERPQHLVRITQPFRLGIHEVTIGQFGKFIEQSGYKTQAEELGGQSDVTKSDDPRVMPESKKINWRTPGQEVGENSPVTQVSWNDAVAFCNWLSEKEKLMPSYVRDGASWELVAQPQGYRLPTEAEWEYACRAGTTTQYWFGDDWKAHDKFGWSNTNGGRPRGVGLLPANPFGLYDMHGNVWEWCHDWYDGKWYSKSPSDDPRGPNGASNRVPRGGTWNLTPALSRSSYRHYSTPAHRGSDRGFRVALGSVEVPSSTASGGSVSPLPSGGEGPGVRGPAPPPAKAPFDAAQAKAHQEAWAAHLGVKVVEPNSIGMQLTLIPPGEFLMGSSDEDVALALKIAEDTKSVASDVNRIQEERPQHLVRITKPFRLGIHEVTIGQFAKFIEQSGYKTHAEEFGGNSDVTKANDPRVNPANMKLNWRTPGQEVGENSPVTQVSWNDAVAFCNWMSEQEKLTPSYVRDGASWMLVAQPQGYRLPTEAEWEYACRAGTTTQYSFGDDWKELDKFGWSNKNAGDRPRGVGLLPANPFGLYDMHGNIWEWCHDGYDGKWYARSPSDDPRGPLGASARVLRGGAWVIPPALSRSSCRNYLIPAYRHNDRGFRVAL